jgi:hypothetical protein
MIKSRRMRCVAKVSCMGETRQEYTILAGQPLGEKTWEMVCEDVKWLRTRVIHDFYIKG